jgi:hypothetical protein
MGRPEEEPVVEDVDVVFFTAAAGRDGVRAAVDVEDVVVDAAREKIARRLVVCGTSVRTARGADIVVWRCVRRCEGETEKQYVGAVDLVKWWLCRRKRFVLALVRGKEHSQVAGADWHRLGAALQRSAASYSVKGPTKMKERCSRTCFSFQAPHRLKKTERSTGSKRNRTT